MGTFAQRLSQARRQCGLTQAEVAEKLNVSFQAVSLWERAETQPEIGKLTEIARLLGVTTDWLLTDEPVDQAVLDMARVSLVTLEAMEWAANILECCELVPMIDPPTATIIEWRMQDPDTLDVTEIRRFAYHLVEELRKNCQII